MKTPRDEMVAQLAETIADANTQRLHTVTLATEDLIVIVDMLRPQGLDGVVDMVEKALGLIPWNDMIEATGDSPAARGIGMMLHALTEATLLGALASEHVAERVDKVIELAFDEGRELFVNANVRQTGG